MELPFSSLPLSVCIVSASEVDLLKIVYIYIGLVFVYIQPVGPLVGTFNPFTFK